MQYLAPPDKFLGGAIAPVAPRDLHPWPTWLWESGDLLKIEHQQNMRKLHHLITNRLKHESLEWRHLWEQPVTGGALSLTDHATLWIGVHSKSDNTDNNSPVKLRSTYLCVPAENTVHHFCWSLVLCPIRVIQSGNSYNAQSWII